VVARTNNNANIRLVHVQRRRSSPRRRRITIRFDSKCYVRRTISRKDYTTQERVNSWCTKEELDTIWVNCIESIQRFDYYNQHQHQHNQNEGGGNVAESVVQVVTQNRHQNYQNNDPQILQQQQQDRSDTTTITPNYNNTDIDTNTDIGIDTCDMMCGLDKYTMPYIMTKKQNRLEAATAVFMEQQQQQQTQQQQYNNNNNCNSPATATNTNTNTNTMDERIAIAYSKVSYNCQLVATAIGIRNQNEMLTETADC